MTTLTKHPAWIGHSLTLAACLVSMTALTVSAHPAHQMPRKGTAARSAAQAVPGAVVKNIIFDNYCVDLSLQIIDGGVFGGSKGCNSPDVVAGAVSTIDGVANTIVVSGYFGYLFGVDTSLLPVPLTIAIFPDKTFKAYTGSLAAVNLIASGIWSEGSRY